MVWYGMVWYGMVWYGMVWYGMVWYGMVWYGMVWYGMVSLRVPPSPRCLQKSLEKRRLLLASQAPPLVRLTKRGATESTRASCRWGESQLLSKGVEAKFANTS